jgi:hypothetical protein
MDHDIVKAGIAIGRDLWIAIFWPNWYWIVHPLELGPELSQRSRQMNLFMCHCEGIEIYNQILEKIV